MTAIWNATGVTPAATDRIPVDVSSSGGPSRWTGQQVADVNMLIGTSYNALGSIATGTNDIDLSLGAVVSATATGDFTFTFSNPAASGNACRFMLLLTNGGAHTITWPMSVTWVGGTAPTLNASGTDKLYFDTADGGTTWYGEMAADEDAAATAPDGSSGQFQYNNSAAFGGANMWRESADIVALRNSTTAQTFFIYNTYTDGSNYERLAINPGAAAGWMQVLADTAGTGTDNINLALTPVGTGAISAQVPDSTATGGNARGANAVDWQTSRTVADRVASGQESTVIGGVNNKASGSYSVAGGNNSQATGTYSVALGQQCTASAQNAICIGGTSSASGNGTVSLGNNQANSSHWGISQGELNTSSGSYTQTFGLGANNRAVTGSLTLSAGYRAAVGDSQFQQLQGYATTTDDTPTQILPTSSYATKRVLVLANNMAVGLEATVVARLSTDAAVCAVWKIEAAGYRGASAATTAVLGTPSVTPIYVDALFTSEPEIVADTANGGFYVNGIGEIGSTIYWTLTLRSTQVG